MLRHFKKKWVYFHIDELSRDAIVASALCLRFESSEYTVCLGNRHITALLAGKLRIFQNIFDVMIFPRVVWFEKLDDFRGRRVILYTESLGRAVTFNNVPLTGYVLFDKRYMEGDRSLVDKIDRFLCWSSLAIDFIERYHPSLLDKCKVVGHPRFDLLCIGTNKSTKKFRPLVGIVTRQTVLNPFDRKTILSTVFDHFSSDETYIFVDHQSGDKILDQDCMLADRLYNETTELILYFSIIKALIKDNIRVLVRIHPRENYLNWMDFKTRLNLPVEISNADSPFSEFLQSVTHIITPASTSVYDAINLGVKPILINKLDDKFHLHSHISSEDHNPLMRHIEAPLTIQDLMDIIKCDRETLIDPDKVEEILTYETGGLLAKNSCKNIVEEVSRLSPEPVNLRRILARVLYHLLVDSGFLGLYTYFRMLFRSEREEGATFTLHPLRMRRIRALSSRVSGNSGSL